jgi:hypothetical protein
MWPARAGGAPPSSAVLTCAHSDEMVVGRGVAENLVFTSPEGAMLCRSSFNGRAWAQGVAGVGVDHRLTFHCLRHSPVSILIAQSASVVELCGNHGVVQVDGGSDDDALRAPFCRSGEAPHRCGRTGVPECPTACDGLDVPGDE